MEGTKTHVGLANGVCEEIIKNIYAGLVPILFGFNVTISSLFPFLTHSRKRGILRASEAWSLTNTLVLII